jgi:hypothetical protein
MDRWKQIERIPSPARIPAYGPLTGMRVLMTGSIVAARTSEKVIAQLQKNKVPCGPP